MRLHSFIHGVAIVLVATLLGGCGKTVPILPGLTPYKMDVQQGNVVTQDMVAKLRPGMTRQQVRFVLGTPPIVDAFRNDRWDYVYLYSKAGVLSEQRRLTLIFEGDALKRIDGDVVPSTVPPEAAVKPAAGVAPAAPTAAKDGK